MFEVRSEASFSAAHHLNNYSGPCENVHGHNWLVRATVSSPTLDSSGICLDFKILRKNLKEVLDHLDHTDLNTIFEPLGQNPSSENIAAYIYIQLKQRLKGHQCRIATVEVCETPGNCAMYYEHDEGD